MSHFTVLVIGDDVEKQMQPYHEYECTGIEDEYVVDVNMNDEVKEYLDRELFVGTSKETGKLDYHYHQERADESLVDYKIMSQLDFFKLKGLTPEEVEEEVRDYHGVELKDGSWFRKTNPNSKWDWWVIGGRWSGFFKQKPGANGLAGNAGFFGEPAKIGYVDVIEKKGIDFDGMFKEAEDKAINEYDQTYAIIKDHPVAESWESVRERIKNIDEARKFYHSQARVEAFSKVNVFGDLEKFQVDRDVYIQREKDAVLSTYAIVKDGIWYSKGEMGWFAVSTDTITQDEWNKKVMELIHSVDDDTLFTLVDCHI